MKLLSLNELPEYGCMICLYSGPGEGKSTTIIQTAPDPILYIATEPRNPLISVKAANRPGLKIKFARYSNWFDCYDYIKAFRQSDLFAGTATVAIDSLGFLMNISLSGEIEDEAFVARDEKEAVAKPIISSAKLSKEGYGGLSSQMTRFMKLLSYLSEAGKVVIVTCGLKEEPRYDRDLSAGPNLKGLEFPANFPGFFDYIGLVTARYNDDGDKLFPPWVRFEGDGSFMCKYTGPRPPEGKKAEGVLDIKKILKIKE